MFESEYFIVRVDAPNDNCPSGSFVTVESGPHKTLERSLSVLRRGLERAHVQPDIVFLPRNTPVVALNEAVPAKPRLVVRAASVEQARRDALSLRPQPRPEGHAARPGYREQGGPRLQSGQKRAAAAPVAEDSSPQASTAAAAAAAAAPPSPPPVTQRLQSFNEACARQRTLQLMQQQLLQQRTLQLMPMVQQLLVQQQAQKRRAEEQREQAQREQEQRGVQQGRPQPPQSPPQPQQQIGGRQTKATSTRHHPAAALDPPLKAAADEPGPSATEQSTLGGEPSSSA